MTSVQCKNCGHDNPTEARFCASCGSSLMAATEPPAPAAVAGAAPAIPEVSQYTGFWMRFGAAIIDGVVVWFISFLLSLLLLRQIAGNGIAISSPILWLLLYYWLFTGLKGQTLGKMALGIKVVNAAGSVPGLGSAALREIPGKIVSTIAIYLGFLWIIWDKQKQGWHDKIANTYVVRVESRR